MEGPSLYLVARQLRPFRGKTVSSVSGNTTIGKERIPIIMAFVAKTVKYRLAGQIINNRKATPVESRSPILAASQFVNCLCFIRHLVDLPEKYDV